MGDEGPVIEIDENVICKTKARFKRVPFDYKKKILSLVVRAGDDEARFKERLKTLT
jgi:hypothetical protein